MALTMQSYMMSFGPCYDIGGKDYASFRFLSQLHFEMTVLLAGSLVCVGVLHDRF